MSTFYEKNHQRRKITSNHTGLIILGNVGVGKSFLANIFAGSDTFIHGISSKSVTQETEYIEIEIDSSPMTIFNIPGLIEAEQERIDLNKIEINKAFEERPNSMIIFIFGHQQGRIRDEDITAFNAINAAYSFRSKSLLIVVNALPKTRPSDYNRTTRRLLRKRLINTNVNKNNTCFIDAIDPNSIEEKELLQDELFQILMQLTPKKHRKHEDINTLMDKLNICKEEMVKQQEHFHVESRRFQEEMEKNQQVFDEKIAKYRSKTRSLRRARKDQQERFNKEERRCTEQNKAQKHKIKRVARELREIKYKSERLQEESDD